MLGTLVIVAVCYTAIAIRRDNEKKDTANYLNHLIVGMIVGGFIGLSVAVASNLNFGEFWEFKPAFVGCVLGGLAGSYWYVAIPVNPTKETDVKATAVPL